MKTNKNLNFENKYNEVSASTKFFSSFVEFYQVFTVNFLVVVKLLCVLQYKIGQSSNKASPGENLVNELPNHKNYCNGKLIQLIANFI